MIFSWLWYLILVDICHNDIVSKCCRRVNNWYYQIKIHEWRNTWIAKLCLLGASGLLTWYQTRGCVHWLVSPSISYEKYHHALNQVYVFLVVNWYSMKNITCKNRTTFSGSKLSQSPTVTNRFFTCKKTKQKRHLTWFPNGPYWQHVSFLLIVSADTIRMFY